MNGGREKMETALYAHLITVYIKEIKEKYEYLLPWSRLQS
jgi:hypothetical protein